VQKSRPMLQKQLQAPAAACCVHWLVCRPPARQRYVVAAQAMAPPGQRCLLLRLQTAHSAEKLHLDARRHQRATNLTATCTWDGSRRASLAKQAPVPHSNTHLYCCCAKKPTYSAKNDCYVPTTTWEGSELLPAADAKHT
jgi:hypothetical protein